MTNRRRVAALAAMMGLLSGCWLSDPFGRRLKRLDTQVAALGGRVDELEVQRGVAPTGADALDGAVDADLPQGLTPSRAAVPAIPTPRRLPSVPMDGRKAMMKLGRGLINLITGWVELPKRMDETSKRSGLGTGLTWGLLRGLGHGFVRTAGGAYEVVTFPFPAPPDYQPIMRPEYVFTDEGSSVAPPSARAPSEQRFSDDAPEPGEASHAARP